MGVGKEYLVLSCVILKVQRTVRFRNVREIKVVMYQIWGSFLVILRNFYPNLSLERFSLEHYSIPFHSKIRNFFGGKPQLDSLPNNIPITCKY